ncbi:hypothetical protein MTR_6g033980 [Medicago truncatula]|uniref:Uncharacterized protein n=1 Tax=Medicago truncatula TaxID=3880 RepID=A0A072U9J7_MEDTR|nr:hypothetical protein MTR_6g033980 [Medicago truncatula]
MKRSQSIEFVISRKSSKHDALTILVYCNLVKGEQGFHRWDYKSTRLCNSSIGSMASPFPFQVTLTLQFSVDPTIFCGMALLSFACYKVIP